MTSSYPLFWAWSLPAPESAVVSRSVLLFPCTTRSMNEHVQTTGECSAANACAYGLDNTDPGRVDGTANRVLGFVQAG